MKYELRVTPVAQGHIRDIAAWYHSNASADVAANFLTAFQSTATLLCSMPLIHPVDSRFSTRRAHLVRFPYVVWYDVVGQIVLVLALTHDRMSDSTVQSRLSGI